jgi:MscS family membrane protein
VLDMTGSVRPAVHGLLLLVLPLGLAGRPAQGQQKQDETHRSPRATVRALLTAVLIAQEHPEVIKAAAACLDLSGLPADQRETGSLLARQLETILRARDVDTQTLPDDGKGAGRTHLVAQVTAVQGFVSPGAVPPVVPQVAVVLGIAPFDPFALSKGDVYVLPDGKEARIALRRMPDGRWLFDRETVAQIPKLYADAQKRLRERNREAASLNVNPDYASARATVRTLVNGYRRQDSGRILGCFDLGDIPSVARDEVGRQLANKLRQVVVRQPRIILQDIPDSNYSDAYVWVSQPEGVIELVRLPAGDRKGQWVFSRDTVRSLDKLFVAYTDKPYPPELVAAGTSGHLPSPWTEPEVWLRSQLPGWLRAPLLTTGALTIELYEALGYVLVPALAYGLYRLCTWLLTACLGWVLARFRLPIPPETIRQRLRPTGRFVGVLFLRWGLLLLGPNRVLLIPLLAVLNPLVWVLGLWAAFRAMDLVSDVVEAHLAAEGRRPELTQMLWPVSSLAIKIGLFLFTIFHLMVLFSWNVTAVLTGLGIGGLAFALGAQDSIKNFFGSFTLIADRPFVVGETVKIGSEDLGVVEVVGLRCTRIRTADDTLLIVPNSNLTTMNITNYGRRRYRRYLTRIGVAYSTSLEHLTAFRDGIQDLIRRHEQTRKDQFEVAVNELGASAVEVLVNVYFEVADRAQELAARDGLILDILRLAEDLHIELAYPTQTIHLAPAADGAGRPAALPPGMTAAAPRPGVTSEE